MRLTERDMLALEWELHHVRWFANEIQDLVDTAARLAIADYALLPEVATERGQTTRSEMLVERDALLARMPDKIQDAIDRHAAERSWWDENKPTAPINILRLAVRKEMMRTSSASNVEFDPAPNPADPPERVEERSERWVMAVRASIAERRCRAGKYKLLLDESRQHNGEWFWARVNELHEEFNPIDFGDRLSEMDDAQLAAYVERSEAAAVAFGVTGDHLIPGLLK
jgi:hypothetical protein